MILQDKVFWFLFLFSHLTGENTGAQSYLLSSNSKPITWLRAEISMRSDTTAHIVCMILQSLKTEQGPDAKTRRVFEVPVQQYQ